MCLLSFESTKKKVIAHVCSEYNPSLLSVSINFYVLLVKLTTLHLYFSILQNKSPQGLVGLKNLGNTVSLNAAFIML